MKKLIVLFCLVFAVMLAGCAVTPETPASNHTEAAQATPEAVTLFHTSTVKIVLDAAETTVQDKTTGTTYSYTTKKTYSETPPTLEQLQARCIARTSADTDTLRIEIAGALIVVHDLAGNQIYYIDP